jgi:hypothetical protein
MAAGLVLLLVIEVGHDVTEHGHAKLFEHPFADGAMIVFSSWSREGRPRRGQGLLGVLVAIEVIEGLAEMEAMPGILHRQEEGVDLGLKALAGFLQDGGGHRAGVAGMSLLFQEQREQGR